MPVINPDKAPKTIAIGIVNIAGTPLIISMALIAIPSGNDPSTVISAMERILNATYVPSDTMPYIIPSIKTP